MSTVPEGQVPRDKAFWATYDAVNREQARAVAILRCEENGHEIVAGCDEAPQCLNCDLYGSELLRSAGFVQVGDNEWTRRG